jgi:hypothetical protein
VLPGYLAPVVLTTNTQELLGLPSGNGVYTYTTSVSPDSDFSLFILSGFTQEVRYSNVWGITITLTLPIPASIAKYTTRASTTANFPPQWFVRLFYVNNMQVAIDTRSSEVFTTGETKEFVVDATGVTKATLTIDR